MASLYSDWLYFLWHSVNVFIVWVFMVFQLILVYHVTLKVAWILMTYFFPLKRLLVMPQWKM